jgi:hypothetical protein
MWVNQWVLPPKTSEELWIWKIYCRIWNDVKLPSPGAWIYMWLRLNALEEFTEEERYSGHEAIRWYTLECRE